MRLAIAARCIAGLFQPRPVRQTLLLSSCCVCKFGRLCLNACSALVERMFLSFESQYRSDIKYKVVRARVFSGKTAQP